MNNIPTWNKMERKEYNTKRYHENIRHLVDFAYVASHDRIEIDKEMCAEVWDLIFSGRYDISQIVVAVKNHVHENPNFPTVYDIVKQIHDNDLKPMPKP
ncbi:MAG: hypothetical protein ACOC3T_00025 [Bacteroidota bacterium]